MLIISEYLTVFGVCRQVFESPEKLYLVMELATGGDLFDQIQARGVFTERDGARVLRMVLDGVRYLHGVGVTHRDLKPDNVLYYHPGADSKVPYSSRSRLKGTVPGPPRSDSKVPYLDHPGADSKVPYLDHPEPTQRYRT